MSFLFTYDTKSYIIGQTHKKFKNKGPPLVYKYECKYTFIYIVNKVNDPVLALNKANLTILCFATVKAFAFVFVSHCVHHQLPDIY